MPRRTIVILGGALSGPTAAARARETDESARIILVERSPHVSYAVGGLAYHLSGEVPSLNALNRERADFFRDFYRVEVKTGAQVTRLDAAAQALEIDGEKLPWDALIYAAGAESVIPAVPGLQDRQNVFRFRTLKDLQAIVSCLRRGARRMSIIGGGFFGVEAADAFLRRRCRVTLLERNSLLLSRYSPALAQLAARALEEAGAQVIVGAEVVAAEGRGPKVTSLKLADGQAIKADMVIVATGLQPRTELLAAAGAALLKDGTVPVDERCATDLANVFACGVCVSPRHAVTGRPVWFAQAAQADKTAQVAGACAAGGNARLEPVLGTAILRVGEMTVARTGLTGAEAGPGATSIRVHAPSHDAYFPSAQTVSVELTYERVTGRVLGAEVAARAGADKRIDVLATAILGRLTVEQLAALDLAYAPPYSAARDPVNVAGSVATAARAGLAVPWAPADLEAQRSALRLIDVRSAAECRRGTIEDAQGVPLPQLRDQLRGLDLQGRIVFLSNTGQRSYLAARIAQSAGVAEAGYLSGGLQSWAAEGRPLRKPKRGKS